MLLRPEVEVVVWVVAWNTFVSKVLGTVVIDVVEDTRESPVPPVALVGATTTPETAPAVACC
jgi:hypothetical protein